VTLRRLINGLLEQEIIKDWAMFKEKSGTSLLKIRFLPGDNEEEDDVSMDSVDLTDLNSEFHMYRKSDKRFKRDIHRAISFNEKRPSDISKVFEENKSEKKIQSDSETVKSSPAKFHRSKIPKPKQNSKTESPENLQSKSAKPASEPPTSVAIEEPSVGSVPFDSSIAFEDQFIPAYVDQLALFHPEIDSSKNTEERKKIAMKICENAQQDYCDYYEPTESDLELSTDDEDGPKWNLNIAKPSIKAVRGHDYHCSYCKDSFPSLSDTEIAFCHKCSRGNADNYVCSKCYGDSIHFEKLCLMNVMDFT